MENKVVNIKGQAYQVEFLNDLCSFGLCGQTRKVEKKILIDNTDDIEDLKKIIVHELFHAYFHECGLIDYCNDETLVRWLESNFFEISEKYEEIMNCGGNKKK